MGKGPLLRGEGYTPGHWGASVSWSRGGVVPPPSGRGRQGGDECAGPQGQRAAAHARPPRPAWAPRAPGQLTLLPHRGRLFTARYQGQPALHPFPGPETMHSENDLNFPTRDRAGPLPHRGHGATWLAVEARSTARDSAQGSPPTTKNYPDKMPTVQGEKPRPKLSALAASSVPHPRVQPPLGHLAPTPAGAAPGPLSTLPTLG